MAELKWTNWKINFLTSAILGRETEKSNPDSILTRCIELAYNDMMNAGRYYSKHFSVSKDIVCNKTKEIIVKNNFSFSPCIIDNVSKLFSDSEKIGTETKYVTRYGIAQKLVNMTFKYLYVFSDYILKSNPKVDFSNCDCPLDSIILKEISCQRYKWSKLSIEQYRKCQDQIKTELKNKNLDSELEQLGNLAFDFICW